AAPAGERKTVGSSGGGCCTVMDGYGNDRSVQRQAGCPLQVRRIVEQDPFEHRNRQRTVGDQIVVELTEAELRSFDIAIAAEQPHDLPLSCHVADLLRWIGGR